MSNFSKEKVKNTGFSMPGYIKALLVMAAIGIVCSAVLFFMKQLSAVDLVMYTLSFAGIFCEFLLFSRGKRLPAVLISLIPLAVEIITEFFFTSGGVDPTSGRHTIGIPEFSLQNVDVLSAVVYIGIPAIVTIFFSVWKKGMKDTIPLIGVLAVIFVMIIEAYVAYISIVGIFYSSVNFAAADVIKIVLIIISRFSRRLMYLCGLWKAGNVQFTKTRPY